MSNSKLILTNELLYDAITKIRKEKFSTYDLAQVLEVYYPVAFNELKTISNNRYISIIGKALIRYSISTNNIRRISPPSSSPTIWRTHY